MSLEIEMAQHRCRICLQYSTETISVHDQVSAGVSYLDITWKLTNLLKVDGSSNEPLHICVPCAAMAETAYNFKEAECKLEFNEEIIIEEKPKIEDVNVITFASNCKSEDESISHCKDHLTEEDDYLKFPNKIKVENTLDLEFVNIQSEFEIIKTNENVTSAFSIKQESNIASESEQTLETKYAPTNEDHNTERLSCVYCEYVPESTNDYEKHVETVHADKKMESCDHCDKTFFDIRALKVHLLSHSDSKEYECEVCGSKFALKNHLRQHLKAHEQRKRFNCSECGKSCKHADTLKIHMKSKKCEAYKSLAHQLARTAFVCTICDKKFTTGVSLHHHNKVYHNMNETPCYFCNFLSKSGNELKNHIEQEHADKKAWVCEDCGKTFLELRYLKSHLFIHKRNYTCNVCGHKLRYLSSLRRHMRSHFDENISIGGIENLSKSLAYVCKVCNKEFAQHASLRKHSKDIHNIIQTSCYYCEYIPTSSIDSRRHVKIEHADKRNVACDQCGRAFFSDQVLKAHLRMCHGIKNYECKICNYKCSTKSHLIRHVRKHTAEKPFQCSDCGKAFRQELKLNIHLANLTCKVPIQYTVSEPSRIFSCKVCFKTFTHRSSLRRHTKTVHKINETSCFFCDYVPDSTVDLTRHLESEHADKKTVICERCDKTFFEISELKCHFVVHKKELREKNMRI